MKKIGLILLALVVALGAMGAGYALWGQTLTIDTTVNMGTLQARFVNASYSTAFTDPNNPATATVSIQTVNSVGDTLVIVINNAFPGYNGYVNFDIRNIGTTPLIIGVGTPVIEAPEGGATTDVQIDGIQVPQNTLPANQNLSSIANMSSIAFSIPKTSVPVQNGVYKITVPLNINQFNYN